MTGDLLVGPPVPGWTPRPYPPGVTLERDDVRLDRLTAADSGPLATAYLPVDEAAWTYLSMPPPQTRQDVADIVDGLLATDWVTYAVRVGGVAQGMLSLMRIDAANGSVEIGAVIFGRALQRTRASTLAQRLLMGHAFDDLGYRRLEWKCDSLNAPSMAAARRLGYEFEGIFRQAMVYKGRNRDTAWWAITDGDWPQVRARLDAWLDPANLDSAGRQRTSLRP